MSDLKIQKEGFIKTVSTYNLLPGIVISSPEPSGFGSYTYPLQTIMCFLMATKLLAMIPTQDPFVEYTTPLYKSQYE